jgi:hypothetical protein
MSRRARDAQMVALIACLGAIGCTAPIATLPGILGREAYPPAMVLATGATGEDCGTQILLVPLRRASLDVAVTRAIASVPEATLLTDVQISATALITGVYNHTCLRVKGSAAKLVSSVVVPMPGDHHDHHDASH